MKLIATLNMAITKIIAASVTCPTATEITMATSKMMTRGLRKRLASSASSAPRFRGEGSLSPNFRRRSSASRWLKPAAGLRRTEVATEPIGGQIPFRHGSPELTRACRHISRESRSAMRATSLRPVTRVTASEERSDQDALRRTKSMKTATARTAVGFRNILFATDFSSAAAHAIPYVKRIAKHYDANLVALHVRPPVVNPLTEPAYWPTEETIRKENEELREQLLDSFAGIRVTPLIAEGDIQS